jgi:Ca-activated chloride channel family protein
MFTFYWPLAFLLLPLPFIAWFFLPADKNVNSDSSPEILFPHVQLLSNAFSNRTIGATSIKKTFIILLTLLWFFLVFALMRPQLVDQFQYENAKGHDIMLAVDISASMRALDFATKENQVSRLEVTKEMASNFIRGRRGDRIGLILFGEYAYIQAPMTFDIIAVSQILNNAASGMAGMSTALGDAIGLAAKEIRIKPKKSRILILLTDGNDTSSNIPPIEAAKIAKHYGIKIYVIGVGKPGIVPYPDENGKTQMIEIGMDESVLKKIAEITGGEYFSATDDNTLRGIYNKINNLEKIDLETVQYKLRKDLYRYPLGIACILFLAICLIPILRSYDLRRT